MYTRLNHTAEHQPEDSSRLDASLDRAHVSLSLIVHMHARLPHFFQDHATPKLVWGASSRAEALRFVTAELEPILHWLSADGAARRCARRARR
eukprot:4505177-Pleurochrysis_carterae.AAC.3